MPGRSQTYTWNDVLSLALWNYYGTGKIADQIFKGLVLFEWLRSKGRVEYKRGGDRILVPVMYAKSTNAKSYSGFDVLSTTPQDNFTTAEFQWKQSADSIVISGRELRAINGPGQVKDLLQARTENVELSLMDELNRQAYLDGTGNSSKDLLGLQASHAVAPTTGTYGGLARSNAWWQNYQASVGSFAANGIKAMRTAWRKISQGRRSGISDLILTTSDAYGFYEAALEPKQEYQMVKSGVRGEAGFGPLTFKGIPIEFDENAPLISSNDIQWWLNSRYLKLIVHPDADLRPTAFKTPPGQDASVAQILFQGEMISNNLRHQGVLNGITE